MESNRKPVPFDVSLVVLIWQMVMIVSATNDLIVKSIDNGFTFLLLLGAMPPNLHICADAMFRELVPVHKNLFCFWLYFNIAIFVGFKELICKKNTLILKLCTGLKKFLFITQSKQDRLIFLASGNDKIRDT